MAIARILVIGTGLIGASVGRALRQHGFAGEIVGWDQSSGELKTALDNGSIDRATGDPLHAAREADVVLLAVPVLAILDWMSKLAPVMKHSQLLTDTGSTKLEIVKLGRTLFDGPERAYLLPGHPMAGKEVHGAKYADAGLFQGAVWLFTPADGLEGEPVVAREWRDLVRSMGARVIDMEPARHDVVCAWVSHLPQMLSTALSAMLEDEFGDAPELAGIGGRALREMTRLGASPFSMWRDVAHTNAEPIAATLLALEQRLQQLREHLKTPELRQEFETANLFRTRLP
jgi:prephenate dehydrogenase